jgi:xanthine dehydrogenase YagR molybdenum-binding subunit
VKFDAPATTNPIDQLKIVGQPVDRIDGRLKTTGRAPYAYERYDVAPTAAYGYVVGAAIAKGRILSIDATAALALPGVLAVVTAENAGKLGKGSTNAAPLLGGPEVAHYHQAIGLVVAESFEQARSAAALVKVVYDRAEGSFDLASLRDSAVTPKSGRPTSATGDFDAAFAAAPIRLDETYATPDHSHAMMEAHASTTVWNGDRLLRQRVQRRGRRSCKREIDGRFGRSDPFGGPLGNARRNLRLQQKAAFSRLPPIHKADLNGQKRVDLARSPGVAGMSANCAQQTAAIDG